MSGTTSPVVLWTEPRRASVLRVLGRAALGGAWIYVTRVVSWVPLRWVLFILAGLAFVHALLAIANLLRNRGVLLSLGEDGMIVWPRSLQEVVLGRAIDHVSGPVIEVHLEADHPGISRADPRVTLVGENSKIGFLPLHGTHVDDFIEHVNEALSPRGIELVRQP